VRVRLARIVDVERRGWKSRDSLEQETKHMLTFILTFILTPCTSLSLRRVKQAGQAHTDSEERANQVKGSQIQIEGL
jgi:hypothetical protein